MEKLEFLVFGKSPEFIETLIGWINVNPRWNAEGAVDVEKVIEKVHLNAHDHILIGGEIDLEDENKVRASLSLLRPEMKIIRYYGGGSRLLTSEIEAAISDQELASYSVMDNPFG